MQVKCKLTVALLRSRALRRKEPHTIEFIKHFRRSFLEAVARGFSSSYRHIGRDLSSFPRTEKPPGQLELRGLFSFKYLAADPGFEPGQTDSKSAVLPLHKSAICHSAEGRGRTDMRVAPQWFLRPSRLPFRHFGPKNILERKTRLELATSSLARRHSTTELLPPGEVPRARIGLATRGFSVRCSTY